MCADSITNTKKYRNRQKGVMYCVSPVTCHLSLTPQLCTVCWFAMTKKPEKISKCKTSSKGYFDCIRHLAGNVLKKPGSDSFVFSIKSFKTVTLHCVLATTFATYIQWTCKDISNPPHDQMWSSLNGMKPINQHQPRKLSHRLIDATAFNIITK